MTTKTTKLKPCPWCGPKHEVEVDHCRDGEWHVTCTWCEVHKKDADKATAIEEWNTRHG